MCYSCYSFLAVYVNVHIRAILVGCMCILKCPYRGIVVACGICFVYWHEGILGRFVVFAFCTVIVLKLVMLLPIHIKNNSKLR